MKIVPGFQAPPATAETAETNTEKVAAAPKPKKAAKPSIAADQVVFSASLSVDLQQRQEMQAKRVESIKSQLKAGTYQVSSLEVAEKMLSTTSDLLT